MITLPIKKHWFDLILSGSKKEEYRNITPRYTAMFKNAIDENGNITVKLRNGYSMSSPYMIVDAKLLIGYGKPEWGAEENTTYYILSISCIKETGCLAVGTS